ncbi:MAG: glycosyltransferase family 4 protein [Actinobacteria bacterium]|nr:glycosyltransferase family 4 protein [Actinomycetota bacterium]
MVGEIDPGRAPRFTRIVTKPASSNRSTSSGAVSGAVHGSERLRIAVVAPPWFEIPPSGYGGIERVCFDLVEGLVDRGHDVTLVAAGTSRTRARFVAALPAPPPGLGTPEAPVQEVSYAAAVGRLLADAHVDVVHDHALATPLTALRAAVPTIITAHGPTGGSIGEYFRALGLPLVAISEAQRLAAPDLPWVGTVPNAIVVDDFRFEETKDAYALFLGRLSPEKGVHLAAAAARTAGVPFVIAGKCNEELERAYFDEFVAPLLGPDTTWIREIGGTLKTETLARARCLVVVPQWEEPFGLVAIEALASGTPVVALRRGALPEIVEHGRTGWLCDHVDELPDAIRRASEIDPHACRAAAVSRYDVARMVDGYERIYRRVVTSRAA